MQGMASALASHLAESPGSMASGAAARISRSSSTPRSWRRRAPRSTPPRGSFSPVCSRTSGASSAHVRPSMARVPPRQGPLTPGPSSHSRSPAAQDDGSEREGRVGSGRTVHDGRPAPDRNVGRHHHGVLDLLEDRLRNAARTGGWCHDPRPEAESDARVGLGWIGADVGDALVQREQHAALAPYESSTTLWGPIRPPSRSPSASWPAARRGGPASDDDHEAKIETATSEVEALVPVVFLAALCWMPSRLVG